MSGFFESVFGAGGAFTGGVIGGVGGGAAGGLVDGAAGALVGGGVGAFAGGVGAAPGAAAGAIAGAGYGATTGAFAGAAAGGYYGYGKGSQLGASVDQTISDWWNGDKMANQAGGGAVPAKGSQAQTQTGATTATCVGKCPQPPECRNAIENMRNKNNKYVKELRKYNPVEDAKGGHTYMAGGVLKKTIPGGHYNEIRDLQRGLKNDLEDYNKNKCYQNASEGDKAIRNQAQQISSQNVEVPQGINFAPL